MPRKLSDTASTPVTPYSPPVQTATQFTTPVQAIMPSVAPPPPLSAVYPTRSLTIDAKPMSLPEIINSGKMEAGQITTTADKINSMAKLSDMDEVGKLFQQTLMVAKGYDPDNLMKGGFFGLLKARFAQVQARFESVDASVKKVVAEVDKRIGLFIKRLGDIDQMQNDNVATQKALVKKAEELVARADWMDANVPDVDPSDPASAGKRQEWITISTFARKRADELTRAKVSAEQQHAVLNMAKNNSALLAMKFGVIKETTVPAMKTAFAMAVLNAEQKSGAEFANVLDDRTNEIMQKNAKSIGQNTTLINESMARSSIDIQTLEITQTAIIDSIAEVERIRNEMKTRLASEAPRIAQLSSDLTQRLSQQ